MGSYMCGNFVVCIYIKQAEIIKVSERTTELCSFIHCGGFSPSMGDHKCSVYILTSYGSPPCVCVFKDIATRFFSVVCVCGWRRGVEPF